MSKPLDDCDNALEVVSSFMPHRSGNHIAIVGAGAFGGWSALHLLRLGFKITLLDAWGPGNSRSSSGGETRLIRGSYGHDLVYTRLVARAMQLWKEHESRCNLRLFYNTGVISLTGPDNNEYVKASIRALKEAGIAFEELSARDSAQRYPQINFEDVSLAVYEPEAGYLMARRACQAVVEAIVSEGGEYRQISAKPGVMQSGKMRDLELSDGSTLSADQYLFACGPWLGKLFPECLGDLIVPIRQEVFFFGTEAGDRKFVEHGIPSYIDCVLGFYGMPGNEWRGFKVGRFPNAGHEGTKSGQHLPGSDMNTGDIPFDPTSGDRTSTLAASQIARQYVSFRFPGLKDAPIVEARVCQYENTPDGHFIIDRHPEAQNVWLIGGGSGHGFKHGPALGEMVAETVTGLQERNPLFELSRFA